MDVNGPPLEVRHLSRLTLLSRLMIFIPQLYEKLSQIIHPARNRRSTFPLRFAKRAHMSFVLAGEGPGPWYLQSLSSDVDLWYILIKWMTNVSFWQFTWWKYHVGISWMDNLGQSIHQLRMKLKINYNVTGLCSWLLAAWKAPVCSAA